MVKITKAEAATTAAKFWKTKSPVNLIFSVRKRNFGLFFWGRAIPPKKWVEYAR
jgi:hypothetical protein